MTEQKNKMGIKWPSLLGGYILAIGTIAFITLLSPNHVSFKYQYEPNRPWTYEDLYADSDMLLLKNPEDLAAEKQALRKEFTPHYRYKPEVNERQLAAFDKAFEEQFTMVSKNQSSQFDDVFRRPEDYRDYGKGLLSRTYQRGIIKVSEQHAKKDEGFVIQVVRGNAKSKRTLQDLPTADDVRSNIQDTLMRSGLSEAEFLIPIIDATIVPNVVYDDSLTKRYLQIELEQISASEGMIQQGELIVAEGDAITPPVLRRLRSYEAHYRQEISTKHTFWLVMGGYLLLSSLLIGLYLLYLRNIQVDVFRRFNALAFMLMWIALYAYLVYLVESVDAISTYIIPFCIAPIVIKNFFNDRLALFTHLVIVLVASFLSSLGFEFTFLQLIAGVVAVLTNTETRYWSRFFLSILYIFLVYVIGYFGLLLIQGAVWSNIDGQVLGFLFGNVVLMLLAYPLIPLLEKLFGFTSSITLAELSDLNRNLLKDLSIQAPGTMQHSLQVANLAEAAARRVGANTLLVKTAALYHDIGKIANPEYYIENQGEESPHDKLSNKESAEMIIRHVPEGVRLAKKNRLPSLLIDFIRTHHGTTRVEFFYRNYLKENPDEDVDQSEFRYPGPKPSTKEHTILMLADSLEAASKSLKNPTGQDIDNLVDKIIEGKVKNRQLEESELTFEEMELCKEEFRKLLRSINHVRIEYPEENKKEEESKDDGSE